MPSPFHPYRPPSHLENVILLPGKITITALFAQEVMTSSKGGGLKNRKPLKADWKGRHLEEPASTEVISRKLLDAFDLPDNFGNGSSVPYSSWP
jgi:hypothetical protein